MELKVVIDKKFAFMILGAILILAGTIYGYAQSPAVFGHDWFEIENRPAGLDDGDDFEADTDTNAITKCANNKFLDGDGSCRTASQIVSDGGGSEGNSPVSGSVVGGGLNEGAFNSCGYVWGTGVYCTNWGDLVCPSGTVERSVGAVPEVSMGWVICVKN